MSISRNKKGHFSFKHVQKQPEMRKRCGEWSAKLGSPSSLERDPNSYKHNCVRNIVGKNCDKTNKHVQFILNFNEMDKSHSEGKKSFEEESDDKVKHLSQSDDSSINQYDKQRLIKESKTENSRQGIMQNVSEDYLQHPSSSYHRRISVVSTGKGRLAGVPRIHPTVKQVRAASEIPPSSQTPSRILQDEEEFIAVKATFTTQKKCVGICLCVVDFTAFLSMSIIAPFFPKEAAGKGMREAVAGFVFSIYALVSMLTAPVFGKLMPVIGAKLMFLSGFALCGICNVLFGLLDMVNGEKTFAALCFIIRSFEAVGAAAFCTASCTILIDQFPDNIGTMFGLLETCMGIGLSIGPAIGGALYGVGGFGLPFFALGGFLISMVPICWLLIRGTDDPKILINSNKVSYLKLLSLPHIFVICFVLMSTTQAMSFVDPTLEPHMRQYDLSPSTVGLLFLLLSAIYGIASPIIGWISGKVENKYPIMIIGLLLVTISMHLLGPAKFLPIPGSVGLSTAALGLLGLSLAVAFIPTFESLFIVAMNEGLPDDINTYSVVSGLWNSVYSLGEVTGPSLGGVLSDFLNFPDASSIMALCSFVAFSTATLAWYNPYHWFGKYQIIRDEAENLDVAQNTQINEHIPPPESSPLQNGSVYTSGRLSEDRKDPLV